MYDELLERLHKRIALTFVGSPLRDDLEEAANAIASLQAQLKGEHDARIELQWELRNLQSEYEL